MSTVDQPLFGYQTASCLIPRSSATARRLTLKDWPATFGLPGAKRMRPPKLVPRYMTLQGWCSLALTNGVSAGTPDSPSEATVCRLTVCSCDCRAEPRYY